MLYNKNAVKNWKAATKGQLMLAEQYHPFRIENGYGKDDIVKEFRNFIDCKGNDRAKLESIIGKIHEALVYDFDHHFQGTRNARQVWDNRKGHCIEQQILLYAALSMHNIDTKWLITKNPLGFDADDISDIGIHPFLIYNNGGGPYKADAVGGEVTLLEKNGFCVAKQELDFREFVAFYLADASEDLAKGHDKCKEALGILKTALKIDPNNYANYVLEGEIYSYIDKLQEAEKAYKKAIKIAPDLLDTRKAYADFVIETYEDLGHGINLYKEALKVGTSDIQVLHSLEEKLLEIGELKLAVNVSKRITRAIRSVELRDYFS